MCVRVVSRSLLLAAFDLDALRGFLPAFGGVRSLWLSPSGEVDDLVLCAGPPGLAHWVI